MKTNKLLKSFKLIFGGALFLSGISAYATPTLEANLGRPVIMSSGKVLQTNSCLPAFNANMCSNAANALECFNFNNSGSQIRNELIKSNEDLKEIFDVTGTAGLTLGKVAVKIAGSYKNTDDRSNNHLSLIFYARTGWTASLKPEMTKITTPNEDKLCGNGYIGEAFAGVMVVADIEVELKDVSNVKSIKGTIKAEVESKGEAEAALDYLNTKKENIEKVSIYFEQRGGDMYKLFTVINGEEHEGKVPYAIQECNPTNLAACKNVMASVMNYVSKLKDQKIDGEPSQLYVQKDGKWEIDPTKLSYSSSVPVAYPNITKSTEISPENQAIMKAIVLKKSRLVDLQAEVMNLNTQMQGAIQSNDSFYTDFPALIKVIDDTIDSIDPTNSSYSACFDSTIPTGCDSSLNVINKSISTLFNNPNMKKYLAVKPLLLYSIRNIPLLVDTNGIVENRFSTITTTCNAVKLDFDLNHVEYRLSCPSLLNEDPTSWLVYMNEDKDENNNKLLNIMEISAHTCTDISTTGGGTSTRKCVKLSYLPIDEDGDTLTWNKKAKEWKWKPGTITVDGHTLQEGGSLEDSKTLINLEPNTAKKTTTAITISNMSDTYVNWGKEILAITPDKK